MTAETIAHKFKKDELSNSEIVKLYIWLDELIEYVGDLALNEVLDDVA